MKKLIILLTAAAALLFPLALSAQKADYLGQLEGEGHKQKGHSYQGMDYPARPLELPQGKMLLPGGMEIYLFDFSGKFVHLP